MERIERLRDEILDGLKHHYAAGHLRDATFEQRVETVLAAGTRRELVDATWDLPPLDRSPLRALLGEILAAFMPSRPPVPLTRICVAGPEATVIALDAEPRTRTIGRSSSCDVVIDEPELSRRHAEVSVRGSQCTIRDLGSLNGTMVNGRRVREAVLAAGDTIRLAGVVEAHVR